MKLFYITELKLSDSERKINKLKEKQALQKEVFPKLKCNFELELQFKNTQLKAS